MLHKPLVLNNGKISQLPAGDSISSGVATINEYTTDPSSPSAGDTWVLKTGAGSPIGLLLALTNNNISYSLSFKTVSGAIVRTTLK